MIIFCFFVFAFVCFTRNFVSFFGYWLLELYRIFVIFGLLGDKVCSEIGISWLLLSIHVRFCNIQSAVRTDLANAIQNELTICSLTSIDP